MSAFPRRVPKPKIAYSLAYKRTYIGVVISSPLVVGFYGEYKGWWKKFELPDIGTADRYLLDLKKEDQEQNRIFSKALIYMKTSSEGIRKLEDRYFRENLPVGYKKFIEDPVGTKTGEVEVDVATKWADLRPFKPLKGDGLITYTSSKKSDGDVNDSSDQAISVDSGKSSENPEELKEDISNQLNAAKEGSP